MLVSTLPSLHRDIISFDTASPLTEPPQTPPPDIELTPKAVTEEVAKKRKEKKQIIDSVTELADGPGPRVGRGRNAGLGAAVNQDVSDIVFRSLLRETDANNVSARRPVVPIEAFCEDRRVPRRQGIRRGGEQYEERTLHLRSPTR